MRRERPSRRPSLHATGIRRLWRWRRAVIVAVCVAAAVPAAMAAAATHVQVYPRTDDPRFPEPGTVSIRGDGRRNDISVEFRPKHESFAIEDSRTRVRAPDSNGFTVQCDRISRHKARCKAPAEYFVAAFGREGDDRIRMQRGVRSQATIAGGSGDDVLVGARRPDGISGYSGSDVIRGRGGGENLSGDAGRDRLAGGRGGDDLSGGKGRDRLAGGSGDDELLGGWPSPSQDRNVIKCGPGKDKVVVMSGKDRTAKDCERVVRI